MLWNLPPDMEMAIVRQRIVELQSEPRHGAWPEARPGLRRTGRLHAARAALGRAIIGVGVAVVGHQPAC